jgi:hypothetical protein
VSRDVLVIGKGKPHHITLAMATDWVCRGTAIWQKVGRRIKYIAGKRSRPQIRDLSCFVEEALVGALRERKHELHDLANVFVNQTRRKRERVAA